MPRLSLRVINGVSVREPEDPNARDDQRLFDKLINTGLFKSIEPTLTDACPLVDELLDTHSSGFMWVDCGYTAMDEGTLLTAPNQTAPYIGGDALGWYCRGFLPALLHRLLLREETAAGDTTTMGTGLRLRWFAVRSYSETVVDLISPFLSRGPYEDVHSLRHLVVREVWDFLQHVQYVIATPSFSLARGRLSHVFWITSRGITYVVCIVHEMQMEMINVVLQPAANLSGQQGYPLSFLSTMHAVKVGLTLNEELFHSSKRDKVNCADDQLRWCIRVGSYQKADPLGILSLLPRLQNGIATSVLLSQSASDTSDAQHLHSDCNDDNTMSFQQQKHQQTLPPPPSLQRVLPVPIHQQEPSKALNAQCIRGISSSTSVTGSAPGFRMERVKQYRRPHSIRSITPISTQDGSSWGSNEPAQHPISSLPMKLYNTTAGANDLFDPSTEVDDYYIKQNQLLNGLCEGHVPSVHMPNGEFSRIPSNKWPYSHTCFRPASSGDVFPGNCSEGPISSTNRTDDLWEEKQALAAAVTRRYDAIEAQYKRICEPWETGIRLEKHLTTPHEKVEAYRSTCEMYEASETLSSRCKKEMRRESSGEVIMGANWFSIEIQLSERRQLRSLEATARSELEGEFYTSLTNLCVSHSLAMRAFLPSDSSELLGIAFREAHKTYKLAQQGWEARAAQQAQKLIELEAAVAAAEAKYARRQSEAAEAITLLREESKQVRPLAALRSNVKRELIRVLRGMRATLSATSRGENSLEEKPTQKYICDEVKSAIRQETPDAFKDTLKTALEKFCQLPLRTLQHQSARSPCGRSMPSQRSQSPPLRWSRTMLAEVRETCEAHRMLCGVIEKRRGLAEEAKYLTELCHKEEQAVWAVREELGRERQTVRQLREIVEELEGMD